MTPQQLTTIADHTAKRYCAQTAVLKAVAHLLALLERDAPLHERQAATQAVEEAMATYVATH
jgi:hypothetical protein